MQEVPIPDDENATRWIDECLKLLAEESPPMFGRSLDEDKIDELTVLFKTHAGASLRELYIRKPKVVFQ